MEEERLRKKEDSEIIEVIKELAKLGDELEEKNRYLEKENEQLKEENKELKEKLTKNLADYNGLGCEYDELEKRNKRQAKQLDKLYKLIENKDWDSLTSIIQEFKECEEQLQKEWETY